VLTSLVLREKEAEQCWHAIISHCNAMSAAMGRRVSLRTAICDYFCSVHKSLKNPKVVEINIFEKTAQSSQTDSLTGLFNRRFLDNILAKEISRSKRHDTPLSVLFLDLDDFKRINDTFGHIGGDKVLKNVANIISSEKRAEDIAVRYGGEELVVISPDTTKARALLLGERIRKRVEAMRLAYEGQIITLTISGGLASFPVDAADGLTLLKYADNALYRAKTLGKNTISLFSEDKRRFMRIDFGDELTICEAGAGDTPAGELISVVARNMSQGGILIRSGRHFTIGSRLALGLKLNGDHLEMTGTVVRIETLGVGEYEIGLTFLQTTDETHGELAGYLVRQLGLSASL
jgi:diguanylate cyclase (GGDEF)-like protein